MIVWKFVHSKGLKKKIVAKLEVPANTMFYYGGKDGKCRAEQVKVLGFYDKSGKQLTVKVAYPPIDNASRARGFKYELGKLVKPDNGFKRKTTQCAAGIHCYMTQKEAASYC